jgi:hypothetical protein
VLSSPANGASVSGTSITLSWNAVSGAGAYSVGLRDTTTNILANLPLTTGTSVTASVIQGHAYAWDVASCSSAGGADNTTNCPNRAGNRTFTVQGAAPATPVLSSPANGASVSGTSITLSWNAVSGAGAYSVGLRDTTTNVLASIPLVTGTSVNVSVIQGHAYAWDVAACSSASVADTTTNCPNRAANRTFTVSASGQPDLTPQNITVSPNPVAPGGSVTVSWNLKNQGTAAAAASTTGIRILSSNTTATCSGASTIASVGASSLAAGASVAQTATVSAPNASGTYYACVIADNVVSSKLNQSNTDNDYQYSAAITVQGTAPPVADLVVQNLSASPTSAQAGQNVTITFSMKNQGGGTAANSTTNLRISRSSTNVTTSDPLLTSVSVDFLASNATRAYSPLVTIPLLPAGQYYIWAIADVYGKTNQRAAEIANDRTPIPITVLAQAIPNEATLSFVNPLRTVLERGLADYTVVPKCPATLLAPDGTCPTAEVRQAGAASALSADGRSAVVVKLVSNAPESPVTFTASTAGTMTAFDHSYLSRPSPGSTSSVTVNAPAYAEESNDGSRRFVYLALLWAPPSLPDAAGTALTINLTLAATQAGGTVTSRDIKLQPPPVLFVHGIWSSPQDAGFLPGTGGLLEWIFDRYPHKLINLVDYGHVNSRAFFHPDVQSAFKSRLHTLLNAAAHKETVASTVDVVAHSMGGLVTRYFSAQPQPLLPLNPVHKLITIGTPHAGSPLATALFDNRTQEVLPIDGAFVAFAVCRQNGISPCLLNKVFENDGKQVDAGGVESLIPEPDSKNMDVTQAWRMLASSPLAYSAIVGNAPPSSATESKLTLLIHSFLSGKTDSSILNPAGNEPHDTIVPARSQAAGSTESAVVPNVVHAALTGPEKRLRRGETMSPDVWNQVYKWLTGFDAPASQSAGRAADAAAASPSPLFDLSGYTEVNESNVSFLPRTGSTLQIGDPVEIAASSSTKTLVEVLLFQQMIDPADITLLFATAPPFSMSFTPARLGSAKFVAVAVFSDMTYAATTLEYALLPSGVPSSLTMGDYSEIALGAGATVRMAAAGRFSDRYIDVTNAATYSVRSGSGAVLSVGANGAVSAVGPGVDWLDASYAGLTTSVQVSVSASAATPDAPSVGIATAGNGQAILAFAGPASQGGSAITSYTATCSPGAISATGTSSPITVIGLTNGTAYSCSVTATNAAGNGPASAPSNTVTPTGPPANDGFSNARQLSGFPLNTSTVNTSATSEIGEPLHAGVSGGKSVWWSWTAPRSGRVLITTRGSTFDTLLAVYTGASLSTLTPVVSNDNAPNVNDGGTGSVTLNAVAGTVYWIAVDGKGGQAGNIVLRIANPAASDFDGDGKSDILWRNGLTGETAMWFMNGAELSPHVLTFIVNDTRWRIAGVGDFDGDGKADILWRNRVTGENAVWLMNGTTIVSVALITTVVDTKWFVAGVGDFDGDGKADILWRNRATGENAVWLMDGATVATIAFIAGVADTKWRVAGVDDFDGDGKADILWRNNSTGDNVIWLMNGATRALLATIPGVADPKWRITGVGDFDGDGKADILWRHAGTGDNAIWLMDGATRVSVQLIAGEADTKWRVAGVADFDGDGKADIVWRNSATGGNSVWLMNGFSRTSGALILAVTDWNWEVVERGTSRYDAASDFNGDGKADILWRNGNTGDNAVWLMNGTALSRLALVTNVTDTAWRIAGVGDFDGDGKGDILWRQNGTGANAIWFMNGTTVVSIALIPAEADGNWQIAGVADFDADGKADILWRNSSTGQNSIWFMSGATAVSGVLLPTETDANWRVAGTGDFDGDGKADILWRHSVTGENSVWFMSGATRVSAALISREADTNWHVAGVGDFDGDGNADILWRNSSTGENSMWIMNGPTLLGAVPIRSEADANWRIARVADYDGDGKADILWRNSSTGEDSIWLMNGPTITDRALIGTVNNPDWAIVPQ